MGDFNSFFKKQNDAPKRAESFSNKPVARSPENGTGRQLTWGTRADVAAERRWRYEQHGHKGSRGRRFIGAADVFRGSRMATAADGWTRAAAMLRMMESQPSVWWARPDLQKVLGWSYNVTWAIVGKTTRRGWVEVRRGDFGPGRERIPGHRTQITVLYRASGSGRALVRMLL